MSKAYSSYWNSVCNDPTAEINIKKMSSAESLLYVQKLIKKVDSVVKILRPEITVDLSSNYHSYDPEDLKNVILIPNDLLLKVKKDGELTDAITGLALSISFLKLKEEIYNDMQSKFFIFSSDEEDVDVRLGALLYIHIMFYLTREKMLRENPGFNNYVKHYINYVQNMSYSSLISIFNGDLKKDSYKFAAILKELELDKNNCMDLGDFDFFKNKIINDLSLLHKSPDILFAACIQVSKFFPAKHLPLLLGTPISNLFNSVGNIFAPPTDGDSKPDTEEDEDSYCHKKEAFFKPSINVISEIDTEYNNLYDFDAEEVSGVTESIVDSLFILNFEEEKWNEHSLKSGEIDEGVFEKIYLNDDSVFYRTQTEPDMKVRVTLLIDESYSMCAIDNGIIDNALSKYKETEILVTRSAVVRKLSVAFCEATKQLENLSINIYGHAGPDPTCSIYEYVNESSTEDDYKKISYLMISKLHNFDGFALKHVLDELDKTSSAYTHDILFMFTDGEPSAAQYSGEIVTQHMIEVISSSMIPVYGIGIGSEAFLHEEGEEIFGANKYLLLEDFNLSTIAQKLSAFLSNYFK